jgi:hypothetical protein
MADITFRLPDDLDLRIKKAATANGRSLSAELRTRLEDSFGDFVGTAAGPPELERLTGLIRRFGQAILAVDGTPSMMYSGLVELIREAGIDIESKDETGTMLARVVARVK